MCPKSDGVQKRKDESSANMIQSYVFPVNTNAAYGGGVMLASKQAMKLEIGNHDYKHTRQLNAD